MFFTSPLCGTLLSLTIFGIFWGIGRTHKNKERDKLDKVERPIGEKEIGDYGVLRDKLDWTAHEAEVANLRSGILMRRILNLEEDIGKIKESIRMSLDVFMEIDKKLGKVEANMVTRGKRTQTKKAREGDIAALSNEVDRLTDLDRQVLNLLSANGPMSSHDLQVRIGKSREHISRLLGKLVDQELIERNRLGRQFTYNIINADENKDKDEPVAS